MFNLEQSIAEWRWQMLAGGVKVPSPLEELETHLREEIRRLIAGGKPEDLAFHLAVARIGQPDQLRTEFGKLETPVWWPVKIASGLFVVAMAVFVVLLSWRMVTGRMDFLLYLHTTIITVGYSGGFLTGIFGIFYVFCRMFRALPPGRERSLDRAMLTLGQIVASLAVCGTVLGMLWAHRQYGKFLTGDAKEIGALCVIAWFAALAVTRRYRIIGERAASLLSVGGNVLLSLAWFGAGTLQHKSVGYWPLVLTILIGLHLVFLMIGLAPVLEQAEP